MEDKILSFEEIKALFPNEWILLALTEATTLPAKTGTVLLHGKDYLEICYKASEVGKGRLTTLFFTGEQQKNRKWVRVARLSKPVPTTEAPRKRRKAGSAKGKYVLAPDFNAPLANFKEYMQ